MMKPLFYVIDPIPYHGGSKVASSALLKELELAGARVKVFSRDPSFWRQSGFSCGKLFNVAQLECCQSGIPYFIKHAIIALQVFLRILVGKHSCKLMGISGPGVDVSVYWLAKLFASPVVQLVHGPVSHSKTNIRNLLQASVVACLESEIHSIRRLFVRHSPSSSTTILSFVNGIHSSDWPMECHSAFIKPHFFWAASLLKWKRVESFLQAFSEVESTESRATICYIKPKLTVLPVSDVPSSHKSLRVLEQPNNLSELRAASNIFVSTSVNEPFGLSILEALAAGLCVVIPKDGAYWDKVLIDKVDCIKYDPTSNESLGIAFLWLSENMLEAKRIASKGTRVVDSYRSEILFSPVVKVILHDVKTALHPKVSQSRG